MQDDFWVRVQPGLQSDLQDSQDYTEKHCLEQNKKTKTKQNKQKTKKKVTITFDFLKDHLYPFIFALCFKF